MKKLYVLLVTLFLISGLSYADQTGGKFGIGVRGGATAYQGDVEGINFAGFYDGFAQFWMNDHIALAFNYGKGFLNAEDDQNYYFKNWYTSYTFLLKYKLSTKSALNPYITAGYSMIDSKPTNSRAVVLTDNNGNSYEETSGAFPVGFGFSYFFNETFALESEVLFHYGFTDAIDGKEAGSRDDGWMTAAIGLSLNLGKAKDTDKDGIPDKIDKDPLHAEDMDGFQDEDGAPDLDNDMDGVPDQIDKAPNEPEDRDGFQDEDGVPDLDNDNDGILDVNDKAPNQAEDKDGYMDDDGAPDPDNDGDGILDADDQCPDKAETVNGYEDNDGCPDTKPEVAVEKGHAIVLEGVTFATGSAKLTENSKTILGKVVRTMQENPELVVEVRGYTDNTGSYKGNMRISQRRADSVKEYLVSQGIDASRITAQGFGPENPIAPNDTRAGRAKNRRIEFFRIK